MRTDKEILDYLESFDLTSIEATTDAMERPLHQIALGDQISQTSRHLRQALSDLMDKEGR